MRRTVAILATLDTKGAEAAYLRERVEALGGKAFVIDLGVAGDATIPCDVTADEIARAGGSSIEALRGHGDREHAAPVMAKGATAILLDKIESGDIHSAVGLGGTQGTSLCGAIMQGLPYGFGKVILSTVASGDTSKFVGIKDVTMMFAVGDILGLNPLLRKMLANAAGAAYGMALHDVTADPGEHSKGTVAMTNLGVLTNGAMRAIDRFHEAGYEVITFHAIGAGGSAMEQMMREGLISGVFDYAMGEIADSCFDALRAGDETRLTVAGPLGIPQVICPGGAEHIGLLCEPNSAPEAWKDHQLVFHSPVIVAPRLNAEEIVTVGREITKRLAHTTGNAAFVIPLKGVSRYSVEGGPLVDRASDEAFFGALRDGMPSGVELVELDHGAEDDAFVDACVDRLIAMMEQTR